MMRILLAFVFVFLYSWSTAYAVNIYVSVSGNDSNPGTVSLPLQTVSRAVELAKTHNANDQPVTITLFAGTYREAVEWTRSGSTTDAPILFQASPLGSATISGSDIFSNWLAEPQPNLYSHSWNNNWGVPGSLGEPSGEVTRRREMVFIDGNLLTQVTSFDALTDNSFYVDETADKLYIQTTSNLNESKVEVGVRKGIFVIRGLKNVTARGIVFQHDTTPADFSAVLFSGVENALVEDCDFLWNTWGGLRVENSDNVTLRRINANHNGGKGTEVVRTRNLLFEDSDISYNNWRGFAGGFTGWSVAGSKHVRMHGAVYRNLIAIDNKARGFWLDTDSQDIVFDGLIALGNIEGGLGVEASQGPITIRNSVICNTTVFGGILASNSENITLENSVLGHNQTGQIRPRGSSGRPVDNWETGEVVELFSQNWTANNNIIFGEGKNELLWYYADSGGDLFLSTYQGDNNIYWNTSPDVFRIQGDNTFGVWQQMTGQEQNSVFTDPTTANLTVEQQRMLDICLGLIPPTPTQSPSNNPPHASFNMNPPGSATLNETTFFDASASFDPDGDPLTYTWDFGDGTSGSGVTVSHTYTAEDNYTVTLTVDDGLDSDTAQTVVNVLPEVSGDGLIAHWALDESSGTTAPDSAGLADGALINGPVWQPGFGRLQGALEFDGVDDYVDLGTLDVEEGTGLTISAWINADDFDQDDGRIISKANGVRGSSHYWMLSTINETALRFRLRTGNSTTTLKSDTGLLQPGVWYHVAATYDGSTMRIYKDGVEVVSTGKTGAVATDPTVSAAIGNQPAGAGERAFDGLIDDVRIYNRALSQIEISALANPNPQEGQLPVASFTATPDTGEAPLLVDFDASSSSDPDGDPLTYTWDFGDGTSGSGVTVSHTYTAEDNYTVTLTVDDGLDSDTKTTTINVTPVIPVNQLPTAALTATPDTGEAPLLVDFDASASSDPDGDPLTYTWDFGDGTSGSGVTVSHTYTAEDNYTVTLTVDDGLDSDTKTTTINVTPVIPANQLPTAALTATPDTGEAPLLVDFDASASSDPDGDPLTYAWDFGDGTSDSGVNVSHTYTAESTYTVTLTVDDGLDSDTLQKIVTVLSGAPAASLTRIPYLQNSTQTSIVIRWRTDIPTDSRVMFGAVQGNLTSIMDDPILTTEHEVKITNLSPDTKYYYAVGTSADKLAGDDPDHFFTTHPPVGSQNLKRILVLGDSGGYFRDATVVRDAFYIYSSVNPFDLWLMLGDNAYYTGTDQEFQSAVFDMYPDLLKNAVLWPTRGNHDDTHSGDNNDYYELFTMPTAGEAGGAASGTEAYYSFDYGNVHFICLDSDGSDRSPGGPMLTWLQQDLASTSQDWIIVFFHHPPYSKGSHNSDSPSDSEGKMKDMREDVLPILEAGGVDLVLTGHSHAYERSMQIDGHYLESNTFNSTMIVNGGNGRIDEDGPYVKPSPGPVPNSGTVYLTLGSSSWLQLNGSLDHPVMISSEFALGFVVLEVDGTRLDVKFIDEAVTEIDSFTIVKDDITGRPVAIFTATPDMGEVPLVVDFDASGSFDPDGDPLSYAWDFGDGTSDSGVNVSHTYTAESTYTVTLTVDDGLDSDTAQTIVNVLPEVSEDGLIAHWALDESSGTTAPDSAGLADGTLINGPVWQPGFGRLQGALEFDGVDDYVDLGALDVQGGTGLTISAWINADDFDVNDGRIISKATGTSGSSHYWMLSTINETALRFRLRTGNSITKLVSDTGLLQPGVWYHVAATYDGSTMRIYKDGVEVASTGKTGAVATDPTVSAAIGNQPAGAGERAFDGLIDDVQIYNRALTQIEITALANP